MTPSFPVSGPFVIRTARPTSTKCLKDIALENGKAGKVEVVRQPNVEMLSVAIQTGTVLHSHRYALDLENPMF